MANYINFDLGTKEIWDNGAPATLYFELVDEAVDAMSVTDTLSSRTQTSGSSTKSQADPGMTSRVVTFASMTWTETSGTPKAIRCMTSARGGGGKAICAWNIDGGNAVDLAISAPLTAEELAIKLAYELEP